MRQVATIGFSILLTCSLAAGIVVAAGPTPGIPWQKDYGVAQKTRIAEKRPMLVFVTMDGCVYCEQMKQQVYAKTKIASDIKKSFIPAVINGSKNEDLADRFGVRIFPTTFLISPENKIEARLEGFVSSEELARHLSAATERYASLKVKAKR